MAKLGILALVEEWKVLRELRNAVNHEYEAQSARLSDHFKSNIPVGWAPPNSPPTDSGQV